MFSSDLIWSFKHFQNPDDVIALCPDLNGDLTYDLKRTKFSSLSHLSIYVSQNFGADNTQINYIGLKGQFLTPFRKMNTVSAVYELRPTSTENELKSLAANRFIEWCVLRTMFCLLRRGWNQWESCDDVE